MRVEWLYKANSRKQSARKKNKTDSCQPKNEELLNRAEPLAGVEWCKLLGPGRKKLVAIRMSENDIDSLKGIAKRHRHKYQQLVIQAVELDLDQYQQAVVSKKKAI